MNNMSDAEIIKIIESNMEFDSFDTSVDTDKLIEDMGIYFSNIKPKPITHKDMTEAFIYLLSKCKKSLTTTESVSEKSESK